MPTRSDDARGHPFKQALRSRARPGDVKARREHHAIGVCWQRVCSCPGTSCLDPNTLGIARIDADYRVRAEGPGGISPWCEPLHVDLVSVVSDDPGDKEPDPAVIKLPTAGDSGGVVYDREPPPDRPMPYLRPGSRERDSLTGEVRRRRTVRRPLQMSIPSPAVPAAPAAAAVALPSAALASVQHRHRRVSGRKQIISGGACWAPTPRGHGGGGQSWTALGSAGCRANGTAKTPMKPSAARRDDTAAGAVGAMAAPPSDLAVMLGEEIDISSVLGLRSIGGSGMGERWWHQMAEGDGAVAGSVSNR